LDFPPPLLTDDNDDTFLVDDLLPPAYQDLARIDHQRRSTAFADASSKADESAVKNVPKIIELVEEEQSQCSRKEEPRDGDGVELPPAFKTLIEKEKANAASKKGELRVSDSSDTNGDAVRKNNVEQVDACEDANMVLNGSDYSEDARHQEELDLDELNDLLDRRQKGEEIDQTRFYELELFDRHREGGILNDIYTFISFLLLLSSSYWTITRQASKASWCFSSRCLPVVRKTFLRIPNAFSFEFTDSCRAFTLLLRSLTSGGSNSFLVAALSGSPT
jgi:hypothetical protein